MSTQTVELGAKDRRQDIRLLPLISGGAALVLVIVAGIALWASTNVGSDRTGQSEAVAPVTAIPPSADTAPRMGGMADVYLDQAVIPGAGSDSRRSASAPTVYVANSALQAAAQRTLMDAADAMRAESGLPRLDATVVVAASPEERERSARVLAELNVVTAGLGMAQTELVVLPDDTTVAPNRGLARTGAAVAGAGQSPFTVFLLESDEAAGRLALALEMNIPFGGSLPRDVGREQPLIVGTPEQAANAWVTIEGLRTTHGRDGIKVVDWRPRSDPNHGATGSGMPPPLSDQSAGMP